MRERVRNYRRRVWRGIERAFAEDNRPREIAASFALGTFVVVLPTAGTAVVLFVVLAYLFERASKLGLLASLVVFNPAVKWALYGASFWVGQRVLGPVQRDPEAITSPLELSRTAGPDLVVRQLLGNVILAAVLAAVGYVVAHELIRAYLRREGDPRDRTPDGTVERSESGSQ